MFSEMPWLINRSIALLLCCVLLSVATAAGPDHTILVVGDSLSAGFGLDPSSGWVSLLQKRLEQRDYEYRVVNASISGDTTTGGLRRLPRALEIHQPDILIIELGGNDGLRGTPPALIREKLAKMIELGQASGTTVILAGMQMPPNYGGKYTNDFSSLYRALADEYNIPLIGFFMEGVALDPALMQDDGIHPNEAGQPVLLDNVWKVLEPLLSGSKRG